MKSGSLSQSTEIFGGVPSQSAPVRALVVQASASDVGKLHGRRKRRAVGVAQGFHRFFRQGIASVEDDRFRGDVSFRTSGPILQQYDGFGAGDDRPPARLVREFGERRHSEVLTAGGLVAFANDRHGLRGHGFKRVDPRHEHTVSDETAVAGVTARRHRRAVDLRAGGINAVVTRERGAFAGEFGEGGGHLIGHGIGPQTVPYDDDDPFGSAGLGDRQLDRLRGEQAGRKQAA